jgi:hypothetical protein
MEVVADSNIYLDVNTDDRDDSQNVLVERLSVQHPQVGPSAKKKRG